MNKYLGILCILLCATQAFGGLYDGNSLGKFCSHSGKNTNLLSESDYATYMLCLGVIHGIDSVRQVNSNIHRETLYCPPESFTSLQGVKEFNRYIKKNPDKLHEPGALLMIKSLMESFPCNPKKV